ATSGTHCAGLQSRIENRQLRASTEDGMSQIPNQESATAKRGEGVPEGLWMRCPECGEMLFRKVVEEALNVCPGCNYHFRVNARERIGQLVDPDSFEEMFSDIEPADPLKFVDRKAYKDR